MKVPQPTGPITVAPEHVRDWDAALWRIFSTSGPHPASWQQMRHWGPVDDMRFDPHPAGPAMEHPDVAVYYAAGDLYTAFAETFSDSHIIDRHLDSPAITRWTPERPLRLLNLISRKITNVFGAAAVQMIDDRQTTQAWARALHDGSPDIDGILSQSSVDNGEVITLFERATDAFPADPDDHALLVAPDANVYVQAARKRLGFGVL